MVKSRLTRSVLGAGVAAAEADAEAIVIVGLRVFGGARRT